jgi:hypothetical protein
MWIFLFLGAGIAIWYFGRSRPSQSTSESTSHDQASIGIPSKLHAQTDQDSWEGAFYDVVAQRSIKKTVRMQYEDGNGKTSERVIDIRAFEPQGSSGLVIAHCHLRDATRTFRFDRMRRVIDMETGEIIPNLQQRLNDEWKASPEPVLDQLFREHTDVLKLLLYMAKADGAVRAAELGVIATHCQTITGDARITTAMVKDLIKVVDVVTITTFTRLYNKLRRERPEDAAKAAYACRAIVATQKSIHPNEQSALDILDKPLPRSAVPID